MKTPATLSTQTRIVVALAALIFLISLTACLPKTTSKQNLAGEAFKFIIEGKELQRHLITTPETTNNKTFATDKHAVNNIYAT